MGKLRITVAVRDVENDTNKRVRCFADGFRAAGHEVIYAGRGDRCPRGADLYCQTGFGASTGLLTAIDHKVPYFIAEAPTVRPNDGRDWEHEWVGYTYNGLNGGGTHIDPPPGVNRGLIFPKLLPQRDIDLSNDVWIIGQKPTDHSLRGVDHVKWILNVKRNYPRAKLRHHPLMTNGPVPPIEPILDSAGLVVVYNSTVGNEAVIRGCPVEVMHYGCSAYELGHGKITREDWYERLQWQNLSMKEARTPLYANVVLSGYDLALSNAKQGIVEHPRPKVDGKNFCTVYHKAFGNTYDH